MFTELVGKRDVEEAGIVTPVKRFPLLFYPGAYWWSGPGINICLIDIEIGSAQLYAHYKAIIAMS
jgi:hypothetical protein